MTPKWLFDALDRSNSGGEWTGTSMHMHKVIEFCGYKGRFIRTRADDGNTIFHAYIEVDGVRYGASRCMGRVQWFEDREPSQILLTKLSLAA